jgi:hypothetical protein
MKKIKANHFFLVMIFPLIAIYGCHSAHDYRYDTKKSLPGWGEYQEHSNFPINGYYYSDIKFKPDDMLTALEVTGLPVYGITVFFANGIYKGFLCSAKSFEQLDSNVENHINTDVEFFGSFQISKDSLFLYDCRFYIPKNSKPPKFVYQILINKELYPVGFYSGWDKEPITHFSDSVSRFRPLKHKPDSTNELMKDTFLQGQMRKGYEEYINRKK